MAQEKPTDLRTLQMELKRQKVEAKRRKKQLKLEKKMRKKELKRKRKEAKVRAKLARRGIKLPPKAEEKAKEGAAAGTKVPGVEGAAIPEAEIIAEADKWTPKSARKLDEIQRLVDRMDHDSVKSLKQRFREKYGEDLAVPDVYEAKPSLEVETAEEAGELEPLSSPSIPMATGGTGTAEPAATKPKGSFFGMKRPSEPKQKMDRPLRFLDYRTPWYLRDKFAAEGGKGKRAILFIFDLILNILLGIFIIKIITTIIYFLKDRKLEKQLSMLEQETGSPQPSS
ncbi:hypothetical protein [[Eubacterium] cellulosolvens]